MRVEINPQSEESASKSGGLRKRTQLADLGDSAVFGEFPSFVIIALTSKTPGFYLPTLVFP
jgi:hypothetical protein